MPQGIPDQDQVLDDIEKIINDLEQDNAVQAILNPFVDAILDQRDEIDNMFHPDNNPDSDEGIELNLIDEIDVEPLDYNLEIDF